MRKLLSGVVILSLLAGCATARLPGGPDIYSLSRDPSRATVVVAKVVDARGTTKIGTIGASSIFVKDEIISFSTNHLMSSLNKHLNLNVVPSATLDGANVASIVRASEADGAVVATIKSLKIYSFDALMQPVEVDMVMDVVVYDRSGTHLTSTSVLGHYEKRIGLSIVDKATGELVSKTVEDTMDNLVKDSNVSRAVQRLK